MAVACRRRPDRLYSWGEANRCITLAAAWARPDREADDRWMATPLVDLVQSDPPASPADSRSGETQPIRDFSVRGREWDALAEAAGNLFATREWAETWWAHFGGSHE